MPILKTQRGAGFVVLREVEDLYDHEHEYDHQCDHQHEYGHDTSTTKGSEMC